jgi:hypothetical protein
LLIMYLPCGFGRASAAAVGGLRRRRPSTGAAGTFHGGMLRRHMGTKRADILPGCDVRFGHPRRPRPAGGRGGMVIRSPTAGKVSVFFTVAQCREAVSFLSR